MSTERGRVPVRLRGLASVLVGALTGVVVALVSVSVPVEGRSHPEVILLGGPFAAVAGAAAGLATWSLVHLLARRSSSVFRLVSYLTGILLPGVITYLSFASSDVVSPLPLALGCALVGGIGTVVERTQQLTR